MFIQKRKSTHSTDKCTSALKVQFYCHNDMTFTLDIFGWVIEWIATARNWTYIFVAEKRRRCVRKIVFFINLVVFEKLFKSKAKMFNEIKSVKRAICFKV